MRITEAEQEVRRKRMLHTAYELFCAQGIDNVSLAQIARAANVGINSIFRYFATKTELLQQTQVILWNEIVNCITAENQQKRSESPHGLAEIRILLYGFENLYQNHSQYIFFAYEYKAYLMRKKLRLPQTAYDGNMAPVREVFLHALQRGQTDGSILLAQPAEDLFCVIWGIMRQLVEQIIVHRSIYEGENPWEKFFPSVVKKILERLQSFAGS